MSEPIVFKHENYNITSDIRLEADVAYIQGHPIVKTKTVVLYYKDSTFRANVCGSSFQRLLSMDVTRPQYTVELINYLSRLINHDNLFEIYVNNRNTEKYSLEELTFVKQENEELRGSTELDKSEYSKGLLDGHNQFILKELLKTMNKRFSRSFTSIDELDYIPVYGYISASGKVDGNWKAEPILHLAIIFNVLAHQDRFSGINNQEAIASFNSIMKSKRLNITAQDLNEYEYKNEIERLKLELKREQQRAKGLEIAKKTLEEKVEDINKKFDNFRTEAQAERQQLQNSLNEANAKLDAQTQELVQAHTQRDEIQATLNQERDANVVFRNNVNQAIVDIKHQVDERFTQASVFIDNKLTGLNLTTATTTWLFIVIRRPSLIENLRANHTIRANQLVLDTICCKRDDRAKELKRHEYNEDEDEIVLERPCSNALDLSHFMRRRFDPTIAYCLNKPGQCYRKIAYIVGAEANILEQLGLHLATALSVKQQIAETLDGNQLATRDYIDERFNQLEAQQQLHHQQEMEAIDNMAHEVHDIHEIALTIAERLDIQHPNVNEHFHRRWYRLLHREADGSVWCEDTKNGPRYYLTEDDINRGRFR